MPELLRTPLATAHEALGARMVPFCGWLMPLQYAGILAEHEQTRSSAGLFDLSHMGRLRVQGPSALDLLQRATTNDASRLASGAAQYSLLCNEQGGVIDDILVYRFPEDWRLVVNAANRDRVVAHLASLRDQLQSEATLTDDTHNLALLGIQGPASEAALQPLIDSDLATLGYYRARETRLMAALDSTEVVVSRTGYTGEDGFEIVIGAGHASPLWERLLTDERVRPVGLGARDTLRLEAGMALYGHELSDTTTPYEAGLGRVVKQDKGPFVGRDALSRVAGGPPPRHLVGLSLNPGAVPRQGCRVLRDGEDVGDIASGTFSPSLKRPIATAFVRPFVGEPDTELAVAVRDSLVPARVVSLPFVPHRTKSRGR